MKLNFLKRNSKKNLNEKNNFNVNELKKNNESKTNELTINDFLRNIGDLEKISSLMLLKKIFYLGKDNYENALKNKKIKNRLQNGLLKEASFDQYTYYRQMLHYITPEVLLSLYTPEYINEIFKGKKFGYKYKFFTCLCEKNINETIKYILQNDKWFDEFFSITENYCPAFNNLEYNLLKEVVTKIEQKQFKYSLSFISLCKIEEQKKILDEDFQDETILKILNESHESAIDNFFENNIRGKYLYKKIDVPSYLKRGCKFNYDITKTKEFFNLLKSTSFIEFRQNINLAQKNCDPYIIEQRLNEYYKELLENYDKGKEIFKKYEIIFDKENKDNINTLNEYIFFNYKFYHLKDILKNNPDNKEEILEILKEITSIKLTEIIIDALFKDNYYNVCLNIKEMLRYNNHLEEKEKILKPSQIDFYEKILEFDKLNNNIKITIYEELKNENYNLIFYENLRKMKDLSYEKIKENMINLNKKTYKINENYTKKYGIKIYDFRNQKYTMLVRKITEFRKNIHLVRNCYSLISNENNNIFGGDELIGFIYGYNTFDNDKILHISETDSFSYSSIEKSTRFVNRIMTSREIVNSDDWYSEIQIINKKNEETKSYECMTPDYLVTFDKIDNFQIIEAKRLNIPIIIISKQELSNKNKLNINEDKYVEDTYYENIKKRVREK